MQRNFPYMVSVRLMTFNHAQFIAAAMNGIMMQKTTFPVEVVVGDDFSQDKTLEIIRTYASTDKIHIRILDRKRGDDYWTKRQELGRLYNFVNIVNNCQGKYVALLDGDDYWTDPLKLQKQVDCLEANQDFVGCFHSVKVVDSDGSLLSRSKSSFVHNRDFSSDELMRGRVMSVLSLCFRNVLSEFPEEFFKSPTGDNFLCSLLGSFGGGKYLSNIKPSAYRMHNSGVWSLKDESQKKMNLILSYFWLWQYYNRTGKEQYAFIFYRKIMMEGFYSDPFKLMNSSNLLYTLESFAIRMVRKVFRLARKLLMSGSPIDSPEKD